jgi:predicted metal-dependent hydrolase
MRHRPKSRAVSKAQTSVAGIDAPVEVRRHPGARRMTLRVSRTKRTVIVTVPMQCGLDDAGLFLNRHLDWVRDRLGTLPEPVPFEDGVVVPLRGALHRLAFTGQKSAGPLIEPATKGGELLLRVHGRRESAARNLGTWLFDEARADLDVCVLHHAGRLGLRAKRIAIRDQSTRWGSCSTTGVLSFSWRLVLAPPLILDYVAAHEVAHLSEMNHGPRFWSLVRETMPQMDEAKRWLLHYGSELHRYGAQLGEA